MTPNEHKPERPRMDSTEKAIVIVIGMAVAMFTICFVALAFTHS